MYLLGDGLARISIAKHPLAPTLTISDRCPPSGPSQTLNSSQILTHFQSLFKKDRVPIWYPTENNSDLVVTHIPLILEPAIVRNYEDISGNKMAWLHEFFFSETKRACKTFRDIRRRTTQYTSFSAPWFRPVLWWNRSHC